jgi:hypothetical protein
VLLRWRRRSGLARAAREQRPAPTMPMLHQRVRPCFLSVDFHQIFMPFTEEQHPRAPSPAPSLQPLAFDEHTDEFGSLSPNTLEAPPRSSRHDSWMSTASSLGSPGIDKLVHQFPSVPQGPAQALQPITTSALPTPKYAEDGVLLTPPDRSSSLGGLSRSATSTASVRSKRKF